MRNSIVYGGISSNEFGVYVFPKSVHTTPAQQFDVQTIPGRNGSLLMTRNRYPDVEMVLSFIFADEFKYTYKQFVNRILALSGYQRLEYSEDGDAYYMAYIESAIEPTSTPDSKMGKFEITFIRKPERYLYAGERKMVFTESGSINNPTMFESRPLLRVYGTGNLYIGNDTITITQADQYTDIDCDIMEAYKDSAAYPKNQYIELSGIDYPTLKPGRNNISWGTGITGVDIIPRWWML